MLNNKKIKIKKLSKHYRKNRRGFDDTIREIKKEMREARYNF